jgi:hypothetical protein
MLIPFTCGDEAIFGFLARKCKVSIYDDLCIATDSFAYNQEKALETKKLNAKHTKKLHSYRAF